VLQILGHGMSNERDFHRRRLLEQRSPTTLRTRKMSLAVHLISFAATRHTQLIRIEHSSIARRYLSMKDTH
ncbi:hypothetical protein PENTCL1PPCAC_11883, partial [Pristionchus entomophagus]